MTSRVTPLVSLQRGWDSSILASLFMRDAFRQVRQTLQKQIAFSQVIEHKCQAGNKVGWLKIASGRELSVLQGKKVA